jgi:hypothetical protein
MSKIALTHGRKVASQCSIFKALFCKGWEIASQGRRAVSENGHKPLNLLLFIECCIPDNKVEQSI